MTPSELEITLGNLFFDVSVQLEMIEGAMNRREPLDGSTVLKLCADYRQIGIGLLLLELDVDGFYEALYQSARAYAHFLATVKTDSGTDVYYARKSQAAPFWDAVAGDDWFSAVEISTLVTQSLQRGMEDEQAFRYYDFVMALTEESQSDTILEEKLVRFEEVVTEQEQHTFALCAALCDRNARRFVEALSDRLRVREVYFEQAREESRLEPRTAQTEAHVDIEGIALVKLARSRQMPVGTQYHFIPDLAFASPTPNGDREDPWPR